MAVLLRDTLVTIKTHLQKMGLFDTVEIGEPSSPVSGWLASIFLDRNTYDMVTLTNTIETRVLHVTVYTLAFQEPREDIEFGMDERTAKVVEALLGEFDLGATVRNVDPTGVQIRYGYQDIGAKVHRLGDMMIPLVIDDNAALLA